MGNTVVHQSLYYGVARYYLAKVHSCRVSVICSLDICSECLANLWKSFYKLVSYLSRFLLQAVIISTVFVVIAILICKAQSCHYLLAEQFVHSLKVNADMIWEGVPVDR